MSKGYISAELRRLVAARADFLCEYCLLHEEDMFFRCEVDHIISERHGGLTREDNLAYACFFCNRNKGSDVASLVSGTGDLVRLFNPRLDRWAEHFELEGGILIVPRSGIGEVTARLLGFNQRDRLLEREALKEVGRYPPIEALRRMQR